MARLPLVLGDYELLERIGEGGMAEVWKARAKGAAGFEKTVVIKRVLPSLMAKPGFADLLVREAKISSRLSHPNIAQVFELGEDAGAHYIAMEYVHGKDLGQAMTFRAGEGLALPVRIWIMSEVAKALEHAHSRRGEDGRPMQIVHRDISPQNVLLGYEGEVKVADFGIARADEAGLGRGEDPKVLRGKYAYMSPEQARGEPLDRRSDVFAAGVVLYELLAGTRLFRGKTSQETLSLVRRAHVPPLGPAGIDADFHPMILKCLALDRDDRYASANELYRDLAGWLFRRGELVGEPDLAEAMARMFPPEEALAPNKLRVDLMLRAYQDATAMSEPLATGDTDQAADRTAAFPMSRRARIDKRRVAFVFADARDADEPAFVGATQRSDGQVFRQMDDLRVAAFGYAAGVERPGLQAVRAAMEFRQRARHEASPLPTPRIAVIDGEGQMIDGVVLEPDEPLIERARALLASAGPGEVRLPATLAVEIESAFRVRVEGESAEVEAFRGRHERAQSELRRLPLVGRREELRQLTEHLVAATEGKGGVLRLLGEAGVGKSRLLAELRAIAAPTDFAFVCARADEGERDEAYSVIRDLVRDLAGTDAEDTPHQRFTKIERLRVLGLDVQEVRLLGELCGLHYPLPTEGAGQARDGRPRGIAIAVALRKALMALAHDRALVVEVEDLQWCDDESRQILPILSQSLRGTRTLFIATARPGYIMPALGGTPQRVLPLSLEATARLTAMFLGLREAPTSLCTAVFEETRGLPAWIGPAVMDGRDADGELLREGPPPPSVQRPLEASFEGLDLLERALLTTTAAFGGPLSLELLMAIEGLVGDTGHARMARLIARRLLVEASPETSSDKRRPDSRRPLSRTASPDGSLHYPLGRWGGNDERDLPRHVQPGSGYLARAAMATLEKEEQGRLHDRILGALERAPGDISAAQLAYHAARGADRRRAPDYLRTAADAAERAGNTAAHSREAAEHCLTAVRILGEDGLDTDHERLVPLALRGLDLALTAYEPALAVSLVEELRKSLAAGDPDDAACLLFAEGRMVLDRDDPHGVLALIRAADVQGSDAREPWPSRLALLEARAHIGAGHLEPAREALERAALGFGAMGDTLQEGRALALRADIEARLGRLDEARSSAARVLALAARHGDAQVRADSLAAMGAEREASGDHAGALDRFCEAIEVARHARLESDAVSLSLRAALAALRVRADAEAGTRAHTAMESARHRKLEAALLLGGAIQSAIAALNYPDAAYSMAIERAATRLEAMNRPLELAACLELLMRTELALDHAEAASAAAERAMAVAHEAGWRVLGRILTD